MKDNSKANNETFDWLLREGHAMLRLNREGVALPVGQHLVGAPRIADISIGAISSTDEG